MRIAIIPNYQKPNCDKILFQILRELEILEITPIVSNNNSDTELYQDCDAAIAIGGDGTIIQTAKAAARFAKPVLGVNAGRLGFMAGLENNELHLLKKLISGEYLVESRMLIFASVIRDNNSVFAEYCLNDAVVSRGAVSALMDIRISDEAGDVLDYRADGVIIATPTGSTAYSVSAGGPVLDPSIECLMVTPICPHSLFSRSVLLNSASKLSISARFREGCDPYLTTDGRENILLQRGDIVKIEKSRDISVQLIRMKPGSFYKVLQSKMTNNSWDGGENL